MWSATPAPFAGCKSWVSAGRQAPAVMAAGTAAGQGAPALQRRPARGPEGRPAAAPASPRTAGGGERRGFRQKGGLPPPRLPRRKRRALRPSATLRQSPQGAGPGRLRVPHRSAGPGGRLRLRTPSGERIPLPRRAPLPRPALGSRPCAALPPGEAGAPAGLLPCACRCEERRSPGGLSCARARRWAAALPAPPRPAPEAPSSGSLFLAYWRTSPARSYSRADQSARCVVLLAVGLWF